MLNEIEITLDDYLREVDVISEVPWKTKTGAEFLKKKYKYYKGENKKELNELKQKEAIEEQESKKKSQDMLKRRRIFFGRPMMARSKKPEIQKEEKKEEIPQEELDRKKYLSQD